VGPASDRDALAFEETLRELPLIDHHVHGAFRVPLDRRAFERSITESDRASAPAVTSFDSQVGFAILRWCAPALGLPPHVSPEEYLARRTDLGPEETNRRLLGSSGVSHYLVDTGFATRDLLDLPGMSASSGGQAREIVRLEAVAEEVAVGGAASADGFAKAFLDRLHARLEAGAVGTKSVVAYRHGFEFDPARPEADAVTRAASTWLEAIGAGGRARLTDPTLLRFALWSGIDARVPLQIHVGFGDSDLHLARANPLLLTDFIRQSEPSGTPILLLHCYPFHREAAYLAHIYPNVSFDVGVAVNYVGTQSEQLVAESLEVAPFAKQLFSSDAWGPAELHHLGAVLWRRAFTAVVGRWIRSGDWSLRSALRVASLIARDNARRLYRL
jgi:predicted TIM-barrel fold metal-dependent hydrolase